MRKVLAIIAAVMLAAVVLLPATGYTISSGANQSYSIKTTPASYSIGMGAPAHNITPGMIPSEVSPTSAVTVTQVPYSIKLGAAAPYSVKLASGPSVTPEGMQAAPGTVALGSLAKNAASTAQAAPVITPAEAAPENVPAPVPAATTFAIMGIVTNETGNMGLSDWMVNLEEPAGAVIANTTTNSNGSYAFSNLNPGTYVVAEVLPTGWVPVTPADGKYTVNLTDKDVTGINFANEEMPIAPAENVTTTNATLEVAPAAPITPPTTPEVPAENVTTQLNNTLNNTINSTQV
ncbi:MAG: SdrD B-like domain-containing protein [Methanotrichaceae archaeon]